MCSLPCLLDVFVILTLISNINNATIRLQFGSEQPEFQEFGLVQSSDRPINQGSEGLVAIKRHFMSINLVDGC